MPTDLTITANDLARAEESVRRRRKAWECHGFRKVTARELNEAKAYASQCTSGLEFLQLPAWRAVKLRLPLYCLIEHTGLAACGWLGGALIVGTASVVLSAVPLVLLFGRLLPIFVGFALCFVVAGSATASVLFSLSGKDVGQEIHELRARLRARRERIADLEEKLAGWKNQLAHLRRIRNAQEAYEEAEEEHARFVNLLQSRRYRLAHCDWRSLRGTAFEDFIAAVFEELGFTVEITKTTGDQGVDLIVKGKGMLIAVQTKGYEGSVGNKAIQEVYAGMAYYRCRECVAITNSVFTSGAIDLARSVGCTLIDGSGITRLIEGELW